MLTGEYYIDMGSGNILGTPYHLYATWFDMYKIDTENDKSVKLN